MKKQDNTKKHSVLISGLALLAMFFGAGNLIFPPTLGKMAGDSYIAATIGFLCTAVGLVMLSVVATTKAGGSVQDLAKKLGKVPSIIFGSAILLLIGPGLAIPRTAATTYEIIQSAILPNLNPIISSSIFFCITLFFVLRPSSIIDDVGKFLTPALLFILAIIIFNGIKSPIGSIVKTDMTSVFSKSFEEGYQTMDALAAMVFTSVIIGGYKSINLTDEKKIISLTIKSAFIAGIGLSLVYAGLLYIGATTSSLDGLDAGRVSMLVYISNSILGNFGKFAMSAAMALACLTTAIGLTSTVGDFFNKLSNNKLSYNFLVILSSIIGAILAINGVDKIVAISVPLLVSLYPVAIVLIFLNLFPNIFKKRATYAASVLSALIPSFLKILSAFGIEFSYLTKLEDYFPQSVHSFLWIIPVIIIGTIATFLGSDKESY